MILDIDFKYFFLEMEKERKSITFDLEFRKEGSNGFSLNLFHGTKIYANSFDHASAPGDSICFESFGARARAAYAQLEHALKRRGFQRLTVENK